MKLFVSPGRVASGGYVLCIGTNTVQDVARTVITVKASGREIFFMVVLFKALAMPDIRDPGFPIPLCFLPRALTIGYELLQVSTTTDTF